MRTHWCRLALRRNHACYVPCSTLRALHIKTCLNPATASNTRYTYRTEKSERNGFVKANVGDFQKGREK